MPSQTELLNAVLGAVAERLQILGADIDAGIAQLNVLSAAEEWLDLWGGVYGIQRKSDHELDATYGPRIIAETVRQRPQPQSLIDIVLQTTGVEIVVRDLWPHILHSDGFTVPASRPLQICDGHLTPGWTAGESDDLVVRSGLVYPYLEGVFGVWMRIAPEVPFAYTLENIVAARPLVLLCDQFDDGTVHVSDGQLITPDFGGPGDTARHSFAVSNVGVPASVLEVMALIDRHRAAGTEAVFLGFIH